MLHKLGPVVARRGPGLASGGGLLSAGVRHQSTDSYMRSRESYQNVSTPPCYIHVPGTAARPICIRASWPSQVLATFKQHKACAVLRTPSELSAASAMKACIDGGFKIVEFTLTTPGCLNLVSDFRSKYDGQVMVGCGTVMDIEGAKRAMDAGSTFLVAPVLVPEVVTWCALHNIVIIPGCQVRDSPC
jgi:hypothetical protein